jgi:hypothetical protein
MRFKRNQFRRLLWDKLKREINVYFANEASMGIDVPIRIERREKIKTLIEIHSDFMDIFYEAPEDIFNKED